jgi:hypothetical protein
MRIAAQAPHPADRMRLLGIRQPGRLVLAVFRWPVHLCRRGWGRLLGRTFLCFEHAGHRAGETHEAIAMVLGFDRTTKEAVICSAWGPNADWIRNLREHPATRVVSGATPTCPSTVS